MDLAIKLIKSVLRVFYSITDILAVDALIFHEAYARVREGDLAYLLHLSTKETRRICGRLQEARLVTRHNRLEVHDQSSRPRSTTWHYIDYPTAVDAIKYRMHNLQEELQDSHVPADEVKEYTCTSCKALWAALEVLDCQTPNGEVSCPRCRHVLTSRVDQSSGHLNGLQTSAQLNQQLEFIIDLLSQIDKSGLPERDFDTVMSMARPAKGETTSHEKTETTDSATHTAPTNTRLESIDVTFLKEGEQSTRDSDKILQQNTLPLWISQSTVTNDSFPDTSGRDSAVAAPEPATKSRETQIGSNASSTAAQIDDIFEKLKADKDAELASAAERTFGAMSSSDEDDSGEHELINVPVGG